jgi:hypothetical protein
MEECGILLENGKPTMEVYVDGVGYSRATSDTPLVANKIYTICGTYDGSTIKLYVNGENKRTLSVSGNIKNPDNNTVMGIGANPDGNEARTYSNINIYNARIYEKALEQDKIIKNYNYNKERFKIGEEYVATNGLILHYDAINNTGEGDSKHSSTATVWKDISGTGNDATLCSNHSFKEGKNELICTKATGLIYSYSNNGVFGTDPSEFTIEIVAKYNTKNDWGWLWSLREGTQFKGMQLFNYYQASENETYYQNFTIWDRDKAMARIDFTDRVQEIFTRTIAYGNKTVIGYDNGEKQGSQTIASDAEVANKTLEFGGTAWGNTVSLNGSIYSIRVYNRKLENYEIKHNYKIDKARFNF